jgi:cysteinyl-tRNA synthetase
LDDAKKARAKIVEWMKEVTESNDAKESEETNECDPKQHQEFANHYGAFRDAMDSDLNTSGALAAVFELMAWQRNQKHLCPDAAGEMQMAVVIIRHTFGCFEPEEEIAIDDAAQELAKKRDDARAAKDFAESDRLRDELQTMGYEVRDTEEGTVIKRK